MSRFKRVLTGSALAAALLAVPVVPAVAAQAPTAASAAAVPNGMPGCGNCWSTPLS